MRCSQNVEKKNHFSINPQIINIRRDYFSFHVFLISSSCSFDSSLSSQFYWETSDSPVIDFESSINTHTLVHSNMSATTSGTWLNNQTLQLLHLNSLQFDLSWNMFYQLSFQLQASTNSSSNNGICVLLHNLLIVVPTILREGITTQRLNSSPCPVTSSSITLYLQTSSVSVIMATTTTTYSYTQYKVPIQAHLLDGTKHSVVINFNLIYQYVSVYIDNHRVFKNEDFIRQTSSLKTIQIQSVEDVCVFGSHSHRFPFNFHPLK